MTPNPANPQTPDEVMEIVETLPFEQGLDYTRWLKREVIHRGKFLRKDRRVEEPTVSGLWRSSRFIDWLLAHESELGL